MTISIGMPSRCRESAADVQPLGSKPGDWTTYRADNRHSDQADESASPDRVKLQWSVDICAQDLPTAPVVAGGLVFIADRSGIVRALDQDGQTVWKSYTAGAIYYPPVVAHDRLYVGVGRRSCVCDGGPHRPMAVVLSRGPAAPPDSRIRQADLALARRRRCRRRSGDTVYAAAGITHYDGTYVVALDAVSGQLKASNTRSGQLSRGGQWRYQSAG